MAEWLSPGPELPVGEDRWLIAIPRDAAPDEQPLPCPRDPWPSWDLRRRVHVVVVDR
jgi:hypothetical protein